MADIDPFLDRWHKSGMATVNLDGKRYALGEKYSAEGEPGKPLGPQACCLRTKNHPLSLGYCLPEWHAFSTGTEGSGTQKQKCVKWFILCSMPVSEEVLAAICSGE